MAVCIQCSSPIAEGQHYLIQDMGEEIISFIERHIGYQLPNVNDQICSKCLAKATQALSTQDAHEQEYEVPPKFNILLCVWCNISLYNKRSHAIPQGPVRNFIAERISPKQIPPGSWICYACWVFLRRKVANDANINEQVKIVQHVEKNANQCVRCLYSLTQRRRHPLPAGPVRDEIAARISPRQIPEGGLVCYSCWASASRYVKRRQREKEEDTEVVCGWCQTSLLRKETQVLPIGPERDFVLTEIHPREIPEGGLVCHVCWSRAHRSVLRRLKRENGASQDESLEQFDEQSEVKAEKSEVKTENSDYIRLSKYHRFRGDYASCAIGCARNAVRAPLIVRCRLLAAENVYLPGPARLCDVHCHSDAVLKFEKLNLSNTFTGDQIADMLFLMKRHKPLDADNVEGMDQHVRRIWLGVTWEEFLAKAQPYPSIPPRKIAIRLCAMTSGESPEVLASLFQWPRNEIDAALRVTKHLGQTKQLDDTKQLDCTKKLNQARKNSHVAIIS